jgi:hypothetical protein
METKRPEQRAYETWLKLKDDLITSLPWENLTKYQQLCWQEIVVTAGTPITNTNTNNMTPQQQEARDTVKLYKTKAPSVGDQVLYVLAPYDGRASNQGEIRPAIIVRVWDSPASRDSVVQLQVFTDGVNDALSNVEWRTSVHQDHEKSFGTFHYPYPLR